MYYRKSYKWVVVAGILLFTAAARAKDSKLRIHVEPKQAYIFVDGVPFGDSGRSINIAPGNHTIVHDDLDRLYDRTVQLDDGPAGEFQDIFQRQVCPAKRYAYRKLDIEQQIECTRRAGDGRGSRHP